MDNELHCIHCGKLIYEGDRYYDLDGEPWCAECVCNARVVRKEDENGMD